MMCRRSGSWEWAYHLPAIIDQTRQMIPNSHVLGVLYVPCEEWISRMPYPCVVMNDASAAALAEVAGEKEAGEYGVPAA